MTPSDAVVSLRPRPSGPPLRGRAPQNDGIINRRLFAARDTNRTDANSTLNSRGRGSKLGVGVMFDEDIFVKKPMEPNRQTRRHFLKLAGAGTFGVAVVPSLFAAPSERQVSRRIMAMSDLHIGRVDNDKDGGEWLRLALEDVAQNLPDIAYGITLGDITQHGRGDDLDFYLKHTRSHRIPQWFELTGNHEYYHGHIEEYTQRIRSLDPLLHVDGNIVWFFLSDEADSREGHLTDSTLEWLRTNLQKYKDHITVVCSHQLVANTVRKSEQTPFQLHPVDKIQAILEECSVDLWLCGHEHHSPYTREKIARLGDTTFVNVASLSHSYGTRGSGSTILDFSNGSRELRVRRRDHDQGIFRKEFETAVPLRMAIRVSPIK